MNVTSATPTNPALERLADAVCERLLPRLAVELADLMEQRPARNELVDATELARVLGVTRDFVYTHADELGAYRLSDSGKPRLRFDVDRACAALAGRAEAALKPERAAAPARRSEPSSTAPLLPIRGEGAQR